MKAITTTADIKQYNAELFKNYSAGSIKIFNQLPQSFAGLSKNWQRTDMYHTLDNTIHEADGFYDVVTPTQVVDYDPATEKLGVLFWDAGNSYFTYPIVAMSQQEQDDYQQKQDDSDQYGTKQVTREQDGHVLALRFFAYIHRQVGEAGLSNADAVNVSNLILEGLTFVNFGEMELGKNSMNGIDQTGEPQAVKDIIDLAIAKVQEYLDNE